MEANVLRLTLLHDHTQRPPKIKAHNSAYSKLYMCVSIAEKNWFSWTDTI